MASQNLTESGRRRNRIRGLINTMDELFENAPGNPEANHSKSLSPFVRLLPDPDDGLKITQANQSKFIASSMELIWNSSRLKKRSTRSPTSGRSGELLHYADGIGSCTSYRMGRKRTQK